MVVESIVILCSFLLMIIVPLTIATRQHVDEEEPEETKGTHFMKG